MCQRYKKYNKFHVCCTVSSCGVEFVLSCFVHRMKKFQGFGPKLAINQSQSIIQPNWPQETNQNVLSGGKCLYSCNHNLLLRKRLWPQSMVPITVPVLHQNHFSVRKIYKNKWKILLFQVNHFPPIGHYCTQRGWKRNVCALPRTEMHFCKSWFAPSKLYLFS